MQSLCGQQNPISAILLPLFVSGLNGGIGSLDLILQNTGFIPQ